MCCDSMGSDTTLGFESNNFKCFASHEADIGDNHVEPDQPKDRLAQTHPACRFLFRQAHIAPNLARQHSFTK